MEGRSDRERETGRQADTLVGPESSSECVSSQFSLCNQKAIYQIGPSLLDATAKERRRVGEDGKEEGSGRDGGGRVGEREEGEFD